jgi:ferredoxin
LPDDPAADLACAWSSVVQYRLQVHGSERWHPCRADEAVLTALERQGETLVSVGCRGGGCGACRVQVTSGQYRTGRMSRAHVSIEQQQAGFALACRLYPLSDLRLVPARLRPGGPTR